ncbi:tetratricopeptide repeat protein [Pseudomonas sp. 5P_3.1_Bac2]|uniref:tetratricopeptide repeat protein n=1 Tax=Pseudomonas sp. 5P_3.1_Bac2 TaxID=2971617 RepID=UPI0021C735F3|nr:tetratricopeptide repeat protein [Pseudomonas sp. 5P_3.1_Bac2]MCU1719099.1 tetratricopeptide repeat protein [Pseudomonas sp. 5P_3.1_Bac2]
MSTQALENMLAKGMDNALLRFGLGKGYLDNSQWAQAAEHLQRCVAFDPNYSAAWKLLGQALHKQALVEQARQAWQQGIQAAQQKGDKQAEKEMTVFLKRLDKAAQQPG